MSEQKGHPKGLYVLFFTEMWERFSYYGMRAILILFMTKMLQFDSKFASGIYGNFTAVVYLTPLIGGFIADRYWGNRRSIFTGGILMAIGQFILFFCAASVSTDLGLAKILFVAGLTALVLGNGLFKPNISTMVNQLYGPGDKRVDAAFSIFYMGINLGAFFSPIVCGWLADKVDYKWGFFAAGVGMVCGLIVFQMLKDKYIVTADGKQIGGKPAKSDAAAADDAGEKVVAYDREADFAAQQDPKLSTAKKSEFTPTRIGTWLVIYAALWAFFMLVVDFNWISTLVFATSLTASGFIITDPNLTKIERDRIIVIYIAAFFVIFFWSAFEQAGASLTLFADQQTDRMIFGWEMPAAWFQSVNALAIILFAPLFASFWTALGKRDKEPASPTKQAFGLSLLALGYLFIAMGVKGVDASTKASMFWLLGMYVLHTWGELCLSPIGLSMVARLAPARLASLLMGVWFLANAMANDFAGMLSKLYPEGGQATSFFGFKIETLNDFFMIFVVLSGAAAVILFLLSKKMLKMMHGLR
ncbi:peptide MFS transporter [Polluticoccus soli]|uniref:peptide MFS transporter n=1 Tax=Polluticoccus soli TaxID=3034150 RepID=UPI0023E314E2|nr:peptide MFS transporter [Flavipsychrobacter sp. JY13-12]